MIEDGSFVTLSKEEMKEINRLKDRIRDIDKSSGFDRIRKEMDLKHGKNTLGFIFVGAGSDGYVFRKKDKTYKIYKTDYDKALDEHVPLDDNDKNIKIASNDRRDYSNKTGHFIYYDANGVRLSDAEAFSKILLKRNNVHMTDLPYKAIFKEDSSQLVGIVGKYYQNPKGIYNPWDISFNKRLKLVNEIIAKTEELYQNGIYHIDLSKKPDAYHNDTNVIISHGEPKIIDIDGHSAVYIDKSKENEESGKIKRIKHRSLSGLIMLSIELLTRVDLNLDNAEDYDIEFISQRLATLGMDEDFIEEMISDSPLTIDALKEEIKNITLTQTKHKTL